MSWRGVGWITLGVSSTVRRVTEEDASEPARLYLAPGASTATTFVGPVISVETGSHTAAYCASVLSIGSRA
jgi:hypothetical protein